jgi:hypothetical protein
MRDLLKNELNDVTGGWVALVVAGARLGYAVYRHHKVANAATWAGRGAAIAGGTYHGMGALDPHNK